MTAQTPSKSCLEGIVSRLEALRTYLEKSTLPHRECDYCVDEIVNIQGMVRRSGYTEADWKKWKLERKKQEKA